MRESNKHEIMEYNGVDLYEQEVRVLEEFEALLGNPIPYLKDLIFRDFGFSSENCHVTGLSIPVRQLSSLPELLGNLTKLKELFLNENKLTGLPESFDNLVNLETLLLNENKLTGLPESFGNLTNLKVLFLNENKLTGLPESFGNLANLKRLSLDNNQLTGLPESFGNLTNLKVLFLYENQLTGLPESFGNLANLKDLFLYENQLTGLPESFGNLTNLKALFLNKNQLESLEKPIWKLLSSINAFSISNNPFDPTAFKRAWRSLHREREEDKKLKKFLETIADSIFPEDQYQELVAIIIEPEAELTRLTTKTTHDNFLGVGISVSRAFYGTLIGAGLIRFYDTILGKTVNIFRYLSVLSALWGVFLIIERFAARQERKVVEQRNDFIIRSQKMLFHDIDRFEEILKKRYYLLETEMIAARYKVWIGFATNVIISSFTTLFFAFFTTTEEALATQWANYFQLIFRFTSLLILLHLAILAGLFRWRMPQLRHKSIDELNQVVSTYESLWQKKIQEEATVEIELKDLRKILS